MRPRFVIVLGGRPPSAGLASQLGLTLAVDRPDICALIAGNCRCYRLDDGFVIGTLFPRFGAPRPLDLAQIDSGGADSAGAAETRLLDRYWGSYLAFSRRPSGHRILRDPSGALPCYYAETAFGLILASDVDLLLAAGGLVPEVSWPALVRHLYLRGLPSPETCLRGIEELLPGYTLDVAAGSVDQRMLWSPWTHAQAEQDAEAPDAVRLRRAVKTSVEAQTDTGGRLLVSVSGGLDSSIVAACLVQAGRDVHCVTMFTADPAGDERVYARELCRHLNLPLIERAYRVEDVDIDAAMSPHLPRPIGRTLAQAYERAHLEAAADIGADMFVTGNGGDNVFGFSQSAAPVTDYYLEHGFDFGLMRALRDVCRQTESGPLTVLRAALRLRRRGYVWLAGPMFLDPTALAALAPQVLHQPWLNAPAGTGTGKAAHVAGLLRVQQLLEPGRSRFAPVVAPLISQPVMEACLAIPSWRWRDGGRDRAVARAAFAADLPPAIIGRRSKSGPDGFSAIILRQHRAAIRERLLDGALARNGVVDRNGLEARFADTRPFSGEEQGRLLDLVDTEAWAGAWSERAASIPPLVPAPAA